MSRKYKKKIINFDQQVKERFFSLKQAEFDLCRRRILLNKRSGVPHNDILWLN